MKLHGNARTCLHSRLLIVERVVDKHWTVSAAADAAGVSERTAAKWLAPIGPRDAPASSIAPRDRIAFRDSPRPSECESSSSCAGCG